MLRSFRKAMAEERTIKKTLIWWCRLATCFGVPVLPATDGLAPSSVFWRIWDDHLWDRNGASALPLFVSGNSISMRQPPYGSVCGWFSQVGLWTGALGMGSQSDLLFHSVLTFTIRPFQWPLLGWPSASAPRPDSRRRHPDIRLHYRWGGRQHFIIRPWLVPRVLGHVVPLQRDLQFLAVNNEQVYPAVKVQRPTRAFHSGIFNDEVLRGSLYDNEAQLDGPVANLYGDILQDADNSGLLASYSSDSAVRFFWLNAKAVRLHLQ